MKKYKFTINDTAYDAKIVSVEDHIISLELNGVPFEVTVDKEIRQTKTPKLVVQAAPMATANDVAKTAPAAALSEIKSPLPGTVMDVCCRVGDTISIGQKVITLEAMKMENSIQSDKAGVVKEIRVNRGTAVMEGDILIVIG
jgi:biotin carboxyl carrier protein